MERRSFIATLAALAAPVCPRADGTPAKIQCATLAEVFETLVLRAAERYNPARFAKMATPKVHEAHERCCSEETRALLTEAGHVEMSNWIDRFYGEDEYADGK